MIGVPLHYAAVKIYNAIPSKVSKPIFKETWCWRFEGWKLMQACVHFHSNKDSG